MGFCISKNEVVKQDNCHLNLQGAGVLPLKESLSLVASKICGLLVDVGLTEVESNKTASTI